MRTSIGLCTLTLVPALGGCGAAEEGSYSDDMAEQHEGDTLKAAAAAREPIMGHFGAEDSSIPLKNIHGFERTLDDLGKNVQVYTYRGASHAFANPSGQRNNPEAATQAWNRTTRFLQQHLDPNSSSATASVN